MPQSLFDDRNVWIFDVDYTLYGPEAALFEQVVPRITQFIAQYLDLPQGPARELQRKYYLTYGSTMTGMVRHHGVDPHRFCDFVHNIDYGVLRPASALKRKIAALPGRKLIFTNATLSHVGNVLTGLGLSFDDFDGAFDVEMADWVPKPAALTYKRITDQFDIDPTKAVFFEDTAKNLETAQQIGWATVWIKAAQGGLQQNPGFVADLTVAKIEDALDQILKSV